MLPEFRIATHPGQILLAEFLDPRHLTQANLARALHVPLNRINELVRGKRGVGLGSKRRCVGLPGDDRGRATADAIDDHQDSLSALRAVRDAPRAAVRPHNDPVRSRRRRRNGDGLTRSGSKWHKNMD